MQDTDPLAPWLDGSTVVGNECYDLHADMKVGQSATFHTEEGDENRFVVVRAYDGLVLLERKMPDGVVLAREVRTTAPHKEWVRRAWVGIPGEKPFSIPVPIPEKVGHGGGFAYRNRPTVVRGSFEDYSHRGRDWSGEWVRRTWRKGAGTYSVEVWTSEENWFNRDLRSIRTDIDGKTTEWGMAACTESAEPMLDWSNEPPPTDEQNERYERELQSRVDRIEYREYAEAFRVAGRSVYAVAKSAEPGTQVTYSRDVVWAPGKHDVTWRVVTCDDDAVLVESQEEGSTLVVAYLVDRKADLPGHNNVLKCYAGIEGQEPIQVSRSSARVPDGEVAESDYSDLKVGDKSYSGVRLDFTPSRESGDRQSYWYADAVPMGWPVKMEVLDTEGDLRRTDEYVSTGKGAKPALDWSRTPLNVEWSSPWSIEQLKQTLKVGTSWTYAAAPAKPGDEPGRVVDKYEVISCNEIGWTERRTHFDPDGNEETVEELPWRWSRFDDWFSDTDDGLVRLTDPRKVGEAKLRTTRVLHVRRFYPESQEDPDWTEYSADLPGIATARYQKTSDPATLVLQSFQAAK
ncbi:MAG: hypothetical protein KDB29_05060 [Planctomycetes bacterium]|nr:hypothetical protein [Planctomycetota bacterium]